MLTPGPVKATVKGKEAKRVKEKGVKIAVKAQAANLANLQVPREKLLVPRGEENVLPALLQGSQPDPRVLANPADGPTVPTALLGNQLHIKADSGKQVKARETNQN